MPAAAMIGRRFRVTRAAMRRVHRAVKGFHAFVVNADLCIVRVVWADPKNLDLVIVETFGHDEVEVEVPVSTPRA